MCDMGKQNKELIRKAILNETKATSAFEKVQIHFLKNGAAGIKGAQRYFGTMDKNRDNIISKDEFFSHLRELNLGLSPSELEELFEEFDIDGTGTVDFTEFFYCIQPRMNSKRRRLVYAAFAKMDKYKSKYIDWKDVAKAYNVAKHPKYINGEWSQEQVLREFLRTFKAEEHTDGKIGLDEFMSYYASISCSIDDDGYFDLMMKNSWGKDL